MCFSCPHRSIILSSPRFCSECGKPLEAGHRFCTNCGATTSAEADARTALTSDRTVLTPQDKKSDAIASSFITSNVNTPGTANMPGFTPGMPNAPLANPGMPGGSGTSNRTVSTSGDQFYTQTTDADVIPPPPPPDSFISTPQQAPAAPYFSPSPPTNGTVPVYAQAPKRSRGCLVTSLVLLVVLVLGGVGGFYIINRNNSTLSKYQPKTVTPNSMFQYAGLSWTLASATESLSANGQQAATGMVYVTVTLKVFNSTTNNFSAYPGDYIRLQSGDSKSPPSDFTIPTSIASQSNGAGTVTFAIPQGGTLFTLLLLAQQTSPPINAASVPFHIQ